MTGRFTDWSERKRSRRAGTRSMPMEAMRSRFTPTPRWGPSTASSCCNSAYTVESGLTDWYHMLNVGYRFPCIGASDYPTCRFLGDCRTYVWADPSKHAGKSVAVSVDSSRPDFPEWLRGAAEGHSFVTTGPLLLLEVDGRRPGDTISRDGGQPLTVTVTCFASAMRRYHAGPENRSDRE